MYLYFLFVSNAQMRYLTDMALGKRLKSLRIEKGLTQKELADKAKISQKNVSLYEAGNVIPSAEIFAQLVVALEADANYLLNINRKGAPETIFMKLCKEIDSLPEKEREALMITIQVFLRDNTKQSVSKKK